MRCWFLSATPGLGLQLSAVLAERRGGLTRDGTERSLPPTHSSLPPPLPLLPPELTMTTKDTEVRDDTRFTELLTVCMGSRERAVCYTRNWRDYRD